MGYLPVRWKSLFRAELVRRPRSIKALGEKHLQTATSSVILGRVLLARKQYAEAEHLLVRALGIREAALGPAAEPTKLTVQDLIKLYDAWGKPEKAITLRAR